MKPDDVLVSVLASQHYAVAREIIEYDIHVLIEKSVTEAVEEAIDLIRVTKRNNIVLIVDNIEGFNSVAVKLRETDFQYCIY